MAKMDLRAGVNFKLTPARFLFKDVAIAKTLKINLVSALEFLEVKIIPTAATSAFRKKTDIQN